MAGVTFITRGVTRSDRPSQTEVQLLSAPNTQAGPIGKSPRQVEVVGTCGSHVGVHLAAVRPISRLPSVVSAWGGGWWKWVGGFVPWWRYT